MARLVIDTNNIHHFVLGDSLKVELVCKVIESSDTFVLTGAILKEYSRNIEAAKDEARRSNVPAHHLRHLFDKSEFITVRQSIEISIEMDDDDKKFLEAAIAGECEYVITQDPDFLEIRQYKGVRIVDPNMYLVEKSL